MPKKRIDKKTIAEVNIKKTEGYDASKIQVLEGLEAVRRRPAMYIGSTGPTGLHHLIYEAVDNSIDEVLAGYCQNIDVIIHHDNSVTVLDDGRGIPIDPMKEVKDPKLRGKLALEVIMTTLHSGGKFDSRSYKVSGGLHGVGLAVVNALSEKATVEVHKDGKIHQQEYKKGEPLYDMKISGKVKSRTGTETTFLPDPKIFKKTIFKFDILGQRLMELSFLNKGLKIILKDERTDKEKTFHAKGGLREFVAYLDSSRNPIHKRPLLLKVNEIMSMWMWRFSTTIPIRKTFSALSTTFRRLKAEHILWDSRVL